MLTGIKETYSRKREIRQVRRNEKYPLSLMVKKKKNSFQVLIKDCFNDMGELKDTASNKVSKL